MKSIMKKRFRIIKTVKILLCFILCGVVFAFCSCENPFIYKRHPFGQPNTVWRSTDGTVEFTVPADRYCGLGTITKDGDTVEIYVTSDTGSGMYVYNKSVFYDDFIALNSELEKWHCSYKSKKRFIAEVEKTTYFEVGQKIEFTRSDVNS